jgi:hypothetical protein
MAKTVVGLYPDLSSAYQAVRALTDSGFNRQDIGILANNTRNEYNSYFNDSGKYAGATPQGGTQAGKGVSEGAGIGAVVGGLSGLGIGLGLLALPGVGPVLAAGYWAAALAGTGIGAGVGATVGGIIGALVGAGVPRDQANVYAEGVRRGGTLVTVNTTDAMAGQASAILKQFNPIDVESQVTGWQQEGWQGFDEQAGAYHGPWLNEPSNMGTDRGTYTPRR